MNIITVNTTINSYSNNNNVLYYSIDYIVSLLTYNNRFINDIHI